MHALNGDDGSIRASCTQYLALTSGNVSRGGLEATGTPNLIVMAVDAPAIGFYSTVLPEVDGAALVALQPPLQRGDHVVQG